MPGDVLLCRFCIGHETELLEKPTPNGHTHKWKMFVRSPDNCPEFTDRSYLRKVTFMLHESFPNPKRTVRVPPFEITETGYGGFDMVVILHLQHCPKSFSISYEMTLPMDKHSIKFLDHRVEIKNPAKGLVDLALKYGAKLSKKKEKLEKIEKTKEKIVDDKKKKFKLEKDKCSSNSVHPSSQKSIKSEGKEDIKLEANTSKEKLVEKAAGMERNSIKVLKEDSSAEPKPKKSKKGRPIEENTLLSVDELFNPAPSHEKQRSSTRPDKIKSGQAATKVEAMEKIVSADGLSSELSNTQLINVKSMDEFKVMDKVNEFSLLPSILSPVSRNKAEHPEKSVETPVRIVMNQLYVKANSNKYHLPMLKKLNMSPETIRRYERPIPLLRFEDQLSVTIESIE